MEQAPPGEPAGDPGDPGDLGDLEDRDRREGVEQGGTERRRDEQGGQRDRERQRERGNKLPGGGEPGRQQELRRDSPQ